MSDTKDIIIPDLGDFSDVEVIEVLVKSGDSVEAEDGLITLETDKATMDVPAPEDGVIDEITVSAGDRVNSGDRIGTMKADSDESGDEDDEDDEDDEEDREDEEAGEGEDRDADEADANGDEERPSGDEESAAREAGSDDGDEDGEDERQGGDQETIRVPDIGDFEDVDVIEVLVGEGDDVAEEDGLITLETDKATMDVPTTVAGKIVSLKVSSGDKVSEGDEIAVIETKGKAGVKKKDDTASASEKRQKQEAGKAAESGERDKDADKKERKKDKKDADREDRNGERAAPGREVLPPIDEAGFSKAHASPSVRKLARELGVDLARVDGSGDKDRILHDDVKAFVKKILEGRGEAAAGAAALPQVPKVDFTKFGEVDEQPLSRIQKISGPRLQASWVNLPHVTQHDLADITGLEERRQKLKGPAKERGISLTPLAFVMRACIAALKEFPKVNASLSQDGRKLVYKKYYHLGFAADTDQGLMVPVIRDADSMDIYELAEQLGELSKAARDGKLKGEQLQGASFTISSLGGIGGTAFTPIVNAPEVAILGVSRASMQPVWDGEEFKPRLMLPLSLSYDHRVIDGAEAVRFTTFLAERLADVDELLEAIP